jgi:hypothetical protein
MLKSAKSTWNFELTPSSFQAYCVSLRAEHHLIARLTRLIFQIALH